MTTNMGYYWDNDQVVEIDLEKVTLSDNDYLDKYMVDDRFIKPSQRYGIFSTVSGWRVVPLERFPPEFRAHLLLLGVST